MQPGRIVGGAWGGGALRPRSVAGLAAFGLTLVAAAVCALLSSPARADEVRLENGDVLHGTILGGDDKVLKLKHVFGPEMTVPWEKVVGVTTDGPTQIRLLDGSDIAGKIGLGPTTATASIETQDAGKIEQISLRRVVRIGSPPPEVVWSGKIALGASINAGNTSAKTYYASFDGQRQTKRDIIEAHGYYTYAETESTPTTRRSFVRLQYDYFIYEALYLHVGGALEYDKFNDLRLRARGGGGVGYAFFNTPALSWRVETGVQYVNEEHFVAADDDFSTIRLATTFEWQIIDALRFREFIEIYPSLEQFSNYTAHSESSITAALWKGFGFQFSIIWDYVHIPSPGRRPSDLQYVLSLTYVF